MASQEASFDCEAAGARTAAALLRLGKIGQPAKEVLVIEASPACGPAARGRRVEDAEEAGEPVVEGDLLVQECDSEEEGLSIPGCMAAHWAPGSTRGRQLMRARARQCVVCMEEKEHTFVPPHREDSGKHVDGHRFCTDCWADFLQHGLTRHRNSPPHLTCPVCRGAIDVPDVWGVDFDLPDAWMHAAGPEAASPSASPPAAGTPSGRFFWGRSRAEAPCSWADVAEEGNAGRLPSPVPEDCSPTVWEASGFPPSRWSALTCPVPTWPSGAYLRRLCDALAGATLVETAGLDEHELRH